MPESYYTGGGRCEDCSEHRADAKARDIAGETVVLCGDCALEWYLKQRQRRRSP